MSIADALNDDLAAEFPAAFRALSRLGRRIYFPQGIPAQSADARGTRYNATIGQVTDGHGSPTPLPAIAEAFAGLDAHKSHLYSPPAGHGGRRDPSRESGQHEGSPDPSGSHGVART